MAFDRGLAKEIGLTPEEIAVFAFVADLGSPLLHAHFPRAYLDVNREPYELAPRI